MSDDRLVRAQVVGEALQGSGGRVRRHFLKSAQRVYGRLGFREDGLFFTPHRLARLVSGVVPQVLVRWADVAAVDLEAMFGSSAALRVFRRDRTCLDVGGVHRRHCQEALTRLGFQSHQRASWPNHVLFARRPSDADWSLLIG